jgi:hypothetical protein
LATNEAHPELIYVNLLKQRYLTTTWMNIASHKIGNATMHVLVLGCVGESLGLDMSFPDQGSGLQSIASPGALLRTRPSTLRSTYSQASLRSVASVSIDTQSATGTAVGVAISLSASVSPPTNQNDSSLSHNGSEASDPSQVASTFETASVLPFSVNSSAASTNSDRNPNNSPPITASRTRLVVTGDVETIDADGVVDAVPGAAKAALRDHLRRRLSEGRGDGCAVIN